MTDTAPQTPGTPPHEREGYAEKLLGVELGNAAQGLGQLIHEA
ncbi:hypothetical protein [Leucobacter insecticola]|nr:hypothetical protein [Leucobacter insecticola]